MKIRFALPVDTTDGRFGEVADVVIDPITRDITHLVVEPHHRHYQARLVPIELVDISDEAASVRLDTQHVRALQPVADSEFVHLGEQVDLGDEWDVGVEHVVAMPYTGGPLGAGAWDDSYSLPDGVTVDFDRIPKGECEIRRDSRVVSADDHEVGVVDGFLADEAHIEGVIVQTGRPGFRHVVVIPIGSVTRVSNDRVTIALDRDAFRRLRPVNDFDGVRAATTRRERIEHALARGAKRVRERVRTLLRRRDDGNRPSDVAS